jgi:hypothetical protein
VTNELWVLVFMTPALTYLNFRYGVYGLLCGRASFMAKQKRDIHVETER